MVNDKERQQPPFLDTERGAYLHTVHTERTVKVYAVFETELEHISLLNTLTVVFSSIGSFFLAGLVSIIVAWATQGQLTESGMIFVECVAPICGVIALLCYAGAAWVFFSRRARWREIGIQSKVQVSSSTSDKAKSLRIE
jgi:hypothetical protein